MAPRGYRPDCVRSAGSPDRHHRIADELLDRAAIADHDVGSELEVAAQGVPDLLGVALLREGGEPDQIGEEDGDHSTFGDRAGDWHSSLTARNGGCRGGGRAAK